ncbi:hypothetical protein NQ314_020366 [Rhamnusium bicolor]|uniref:THAP-type domain-containing protein n=1 Tax=Rhamnusium bicolor TaxID=1586634 RepID=A0AAV8WKV4_9CUCU|nr:hypothetical protein NQ314_020366 [Rhamnusium bicolor]
MPTKCSIRGCDTFYARGKPFFNLPTEVKYKYAWDKAQLAKKRRKLWLEAMGLLDDEPSKMIRICSKHFLSGKPAALENTTDIDWVPSFSMNLLHSPAKEQQKRQIEEQDKKKQNLNKHTSSHHSTSSHRPTSSHRSTSSHHSDSHRSTSSHRHTSSKRSGSSRKNTKYNGRKSELKKLNCKVLLDGTLRSTTFNGTNGSGLAIFQKYGSFTSDNVTLKEAAINNTVLRIHLFREDLNDLKRRYKLVQDLNSNKRKREIQQVSSFGRQLKKKRYLYDYDRTLSSSSAEIRNYRQSPNVDSDSEESENNSFVNISKAAIAQMKIKSEIEGKRHSRIEVKPATVRYSFENNKTLNRAIKKNDRDKIKVKFFPRTSTPMRSIINGTITKVKPDESLQLHREILFVKQYKNAHPSQKPDQKYYLRFPYHRYHDDGRLSYAFQKLVTDVKHMKLPAPSWKIKVIIRQGKISAITFTNKLELERCISFSVNSDRYRITIDNRPALLLGSPDSVNNARELEILLDIVQNIDSGNPMIFYK